MNARITDRLAARIQSRLAASQEDSQAGMVTSEWAVGTVAAAGCGGVLYKVVTSEQVLELVKKVILKAFHLNF
jgi:hypothetical protein